MSFSQNMKEFTFRTISPNMKPLLLPTPPLTNTITSEITHLMNLKNGYTNKVKTLVLTKMKTTLKSQDASLPPSPHMSTYNHYHQPLVLFFYYALYISSFLFLSLYNNFTDLSVSRSSYYAYVLTHHVTWFEKHNHHDASIFGVYKCEPLPN